jgi:hypothetical protein
MQGVTMKKSGMFASALVALAVALGALAFGAEAQAVAHSSGCARGKEASGCNINGTGYGELKSRVTVGFPFSTSPKGTLTELSVPVTFACPKVTEEAYLAVKSKDKPRIGSTMRFSGKTEVKLYTGESAASAKAVKSGKISGKLKITSAKTASLTGKVEVTLTDGSKCSKQLPKKLTRILGG